MTATNGAFARARAMFAAVRAILALNLAPIERQARLAALGPYVSRGKGKGRAPNGPTGIVAARRAARKRRNQQRAKGR